MGGNIQACLLILRCSPSFPHTLSTSTSSYKEDSPIISNFWKVMRSFDSHMQARVLQVGGSFSLLLEERRQA